LRFRFMAFKFNKSHNKLLISLNDGCS